MSKNSVDITRYSLLIPLRRQPEIVAVQADQQAFQLQHLGVPQHGPRRVEAAVRCFLALDQDRFALRGEGEQPGLLLHPAAALASLLQRSRILSACVPVCAPGARLPRRASRFRCAKAAWTHPMPAHCPEAGPHRQPRVVAVRVEVAHVLVEPDGQRCGRARIVAPRNTQASLGGRLGCGQARHHEAVQQFHQLGEVCVRQRLERQHGMIRGLDQVLDCRMPMLREAELAGCACRGQQAQPLACCEACSESRAGDVNTAADAQPRNGNRLRLEDVRSHEPAVPFAVWMPSDSAAWSILGPYCARSAISASRKTGQTP